MSSVESKISDCALLIDNCFLTSEHFWRLKFYVETTTPTLYRETGE